MKMQDNIVRFLRAIGEEDLLVECAPKWMWIRKLPELFVPCPMCAGSTDVNLREKPYYAFCNLCGQKWDLRGNPVGRGKEEVWRARHRFVLERKNDKSNGHKYGCDLDKTNLEYAQCQRP